MFVERPANTTRVWRFGVFEVDAADGELRRGGRPVKMREQSFRILVFLLEHSGEVVTREELRAVLWPSDTFVDFDHSLNTAVMKLRDALGDSAETPLYIETLPKRGYRFIAPMAIVEPEARTISSVIPAETSSGASRVPPHRFLWTVAAIAFLLFAAAGSIWFLRARHFRASTADERQLASAFQIVPITTAPGDAITPAFSPDGREIAFAWDGPERKRYDIYVQLVGADMPLQLTHSKRGLVGAPAWSPDGNEIAFSRCDGKNDGVFVVPALGGAERQLTTVGCLYTLPGPLAWIDGGKEMLMIDHCSGTVPLVWCSSRSQRATNIASPIRDLPKARMQDTDFPSRRTAGRSRLPVRPYLYAAMCIRFRSQAERLGCSPTTAAWAAVRLTSLAALD
jgi:DNA-binding winged helix-turn-helix (wHTH) protein